MTPGSRLACKARILILVALVAFLLPGCRTGGSRRHPDSANEPSVLIYTVSSNNETLTGIAQRYRLTVDEIVKANALRGNKLVAGQKLRLPGAREFVPPPIKAPAAKPADPAEQNYALPRAAWAKQGIDKNNIDPMGEKRRITIHHSGDDIDLGAEPIETLRRIEEQHKLGQGKNQPFACIGYHFLISADGRVWEGRPLKFQGAHATGDNNKGNIGICLLGNFDNQFVTKAQRAALGTLVDRLCGDFAIDRADIFGHKDFKDTDCPGRHALPIVAALKE
jgi:LysM repeat protein